MANRDQDDEFQLSPAVAEKKGKKKEKKRKKRSRRFVIIHIPRGEFGGR